MMNMKESTTEAIVAIILGIAYTLLAVLAIIGGAICRDNFSGLLQLLGNILVVLGIICLVAFWGIVWYVCKPIKIQSRASRIAQSLDDGCEHLAAGYAKRNKGD